MPSLLVQQRFYESSFDAELNSYPPFASVNIKKCVETHNALLGKTYPANFMILTIWEHKNISKKYSSNFL